MRVIIFFLILFSSYSWAQEPEKSADKSRASNKSEASRSDTNNTTDSYDDLFKSLDYPELQVVPKASERLVMEAEYESDYWYTKNWTMFASSLATYYASTQTKGKYHTEIPTDDEKNKADSAVQVASIVGISGMLASFILPIMKPYAGGVQSLRSAKGRDKRQALLRERLAEEILERQASTQRVISTVSVIANFAASSQLIGKVATSTEKYAYVSLGLAFLPWLFSSRESQAYEKHLEYKKKIYTPISSIDFLVSPKTGKLEPLYVLNWQF